MMDALLPEQLQYWLIYEAEKELDLFEIFLLLLAFPNLVLTLVGSVGLFFRKKWGAWLYLGCTAFTYCLMPFYGPTVEHALVTTIYDIVLTIAGVIIGMILFTNVVLERPLVD